LALQMTVVIKHQNDENKINYRTFVEQLPFVAYIASLEQQGKLVYLSPQIQQLGYPLDDWLSDPQGFLKWVHPDDLSKVSKAYAQTYKHQVPLRCEYQLVRCDGVARWFLDEATVVRDDTDGNLYLHGILVDITKFKKAEQELSYYHRRLEELVTDRTMQLEKQCAVLKSANLNLDNILNDHRQREAELRARETHFKDLLESNSEGILGVDTKGLCTFINQSALAMLGYSQEELLYQDIHAAIYKSNTDGKAIQAEQWLINNALRNENHSSSAEIFQCKNGESLYVECSAYPMRHGAQIIGAVMIFRKVSESLCYQASHDALTGLLNRAEFEKRVARVLANVHTEKAEHVLCYLEFDKLKVIKNTCGHAARDELIHKAAALLKTRLRQRDTIAFFGGDEFSLLLEHCTINQALKIADELRASVMSWGFSWNYESFLVDVSIGLTALTSSYGCNECRRVCLPTGPKKRIQPNYVSE
jgi:diguanylate cyclase